MIFLCVIVEFVLLKPNLNTRLGCVTRVFKFFIKNCIFY